MRLPFRRTPPPMSCQQLVELVTEYFEGTLSAADTRRFDQHIEACFWCARYVEQLRVTVRTVGRLDSEALPAEMRDSLLHEFRNWHAERA